MRKIADSTVRRLSLYLRFLEAFEQQGVETVSSDELARQGSTTSAQVRKDLSFFGSFGKRGLGYSVPDLARRLREILGLSREYRVVVIGAGNIGVALVKFGGFEERGFHVVGVYDIDPAKVGMRIRNITVRDEARLEDDLRANPVDMAVLVTPADVVQSVADRLIDSGIRAILNFAPVQLKVPDFVTVKNVNLALELEALSYGLASG